MIPTDFVAKLRCPVTGNPLRLLDRGNALEIIKKLLGPGGDSGNMAEFLDAGLMTEDASRVYPIRNGVICLLPSLAITAVAQGRTIPAGTAEAIKHKVREFYDELGWEKSAGHFADAIIYEDLRPVAADYVHRCHMRVAQHLPATGSYLLDVASGPVQYDEYLVYSKGYRRRVCVDISFRALIEARKRLGENGLYIAADITNLPFADNSFDGIVSLHTIYHVPATEQETAFNELYRVLAPGGAAVVVYSWGRHSPLMLISLLPFWAWAWLIRRFRRRFHGDGATSDGPGSKRVLYSHHNSYRWFASRRWPFSHRLYCWRSVSVDFTKIYMRSWLFGRELLSLLFRLEGAWPRLLGRIGQYPMIVFEKPRS